MKTGYLGTMAYVHNTLPSMAPSKVISDFFLTQKGHLFSWCFCRFSSNVSINISNLPKMKKLITWDMGKTYSYFNKLVLQNARLNV